MWNKRSRRPCHWRVPRCAHSKLAGYDKTIAVGVILGFALLQWRGVKWGSGAQLLTAALKSGAFLVLVLACFVLGGSTHSAAMAAPKPSIAAGWLLALG